MAFSFQKSVTVSVFAMWCRNIGEYDLCCTSMDVSVGRPGFQISITSDAAADAAPTKTNSINNRYLFHH
ncbi:MAG: hypothetical protein JRC86_11970 [Deltaproteobacteria bacterium]|nr:hypothetical protein [Deltaproteobacteria bacterium]